MYSIFADDLCIYNDRTDDVSVRLVSPNLEFTDNSAGKLSFTMPTVNVGYNTVQRLVSTIKVIKDNEEVFEGRILTESKDFWNNRVITCEGELNYLNDTIQPQRELVNPTPRSFLETLIEYHNSHASADKQFTVGIVTVTGNMRNEEGDDEYYDDIVVYTNYETTIDLINDKLINNEDTEGHLRIRKVNDIRYIDYLKDLTDTCRQTIEFGKNLMDFTVDYDETDFCTRLIPLGERYLEGTIEGLEGYLDITEVNHGLNYIQNDQAVATFGIIEKVEHFDDVTDDEELLTKAQEFLQDIQFGKMELEVTAVDLSMLGTGEPELKFQQLVQVRSIPHGLDRVFPVLGVSIPLDDISNTKYTLGDGKKVSSLTTYSGNISHELSQEIKQDINKNGILKQAQDNAGALINTATSGYITIVHGQDGKADELIISNLKDYNQATKLWKWNINGLGYFPNGVESTPLAAITMDGAIVADRITTGTLSCDRLNGGTITGQNIVGGTITGNTSFNVNGNFLVDGNGNFTSNGDAKLYGDVKYIQKHEVGSTSGNQNALQFYGAGGDSSNNYIGGLYFSKTDDLVGHMERYISIEGQTDFMARSGCHSDGYDYNAQLTLDERGIELSGYDFNSNSRDFDIFISGSPRTVDGVSNVYFNVRTPDGASLILTTNGLRVNGRWI